MNLINLLLRPSFDKCFKEILELKCWKDFKLALILSTIPELKLIEKTEWDSRYKEVINYLNEEYNPFGICLYPLYDFVSDDLKLEYDTIHCLIRSILNDQFK